MSTQIKINYKEYPEFMFAMISAYLPKEEASIVSKLAGRVIFRHEDKYGDTFKNGLRHSYDDKPSVERYYDNYRSWHCDGELHRDNDLPAIVCNDYKEWRIHGMIHRDNDLPAIVFPEAQFWYKDNMRHRGDDKPAIINKNYQAWFINGNRHREGDMPAVIDLFHQAWYIDGNLVKEVYF